MSEVKKLFTKRRILVAAGILLLLAGASVAGVITSQLVKQPDQPKQTQSGLPENIDEVQNLRLQGKTEEANKKADEILNQTGTSNDTKYLLYVQKAQASLSAGDKKATLDFYTQAANVKPTQNIYTSIGEINYLLGNKDDAKAAYQKAITLIDPNSPLHDADKIDLEQRIEVIDGKEVQQ